LEDGVPTAPIPFADAKADADAGADHTNPTAGIQHSFDRELPSIAINDQEPIVILDDDPISTPHEIPAHVLHDVVRYAQARLVAGVGADALRQLGVDHPALIAAYRIGYLPLDWQEACGRVVRQAFSGHRLANTIVVPAFDASGTIVDLLAVHPRVRGGAYVGIQDPPRGLLAPAIATTHHELTITDSLRVAARRFVAGSTDALVLRGPADAMANAARLHAAGVRRVLVRTRMNADAIAAALRSAGIATAVVSAHAQWDGVGYDAVMLPVAAVVAESAPSASASADEGAAADVSSVPSASPLLPADTVDDPHDPGAATSAAASPACPRLVTHDRQAERATFTMGAITYVVEVPHDDTTTRLEVVIRHTGQVHRELVDLAVVAARSRFAGNAALRCGLAAASIAEHLPHLLAGVQAVHQTTTAPLVAEPDAVLPGPERDEALALLRSPNLIDFLVSDLDTLGWVGEADARCVLLLTAVSRKLPEPLWAIRTASGDVTGSHGVDLIAALTPPEDLLHVSRLSNAALGYQDAHALQHKLLVIDEATALSSETLLALRVLRHRGALSQAVVPRHNLSGSARTQTIEVRGPIAVLSATAGRLDQTLTASCCLVPVDESPAQTARVLAAERQRYAAPPASRDAARATIIRRHHTLQRLLARRPVVIPFVDRIEFPATVLRSRSAQARFLGLVAASALLHQHQRLSDQGHVVADVRDAELAATLTAAAGIGVDHDHGLGRPATVLLTALRDAGLTSFTADDVRTLLPHWGRTSFRSAVADLLRLDYVSSPEGGRGQRRSYTLIAGQQPAQRPTITRHPVTTAAELVSWSVVGQFATSQLNSRPRPEIDAVG